MITRRGVPMRALLAAMALIVAGSLGAGPASARGPAKHWHAKHGLSLRQLAGQRVIYSYPGLTPPDALLRHIRRGEAGGVIFFGENISSTAQIRGVVEQLQAANRESPVHAPLLMMTDQEGGIVRRLPGEPILSEKQIGASDHAVELARQAGTDAGENLRGAAMNLNLAPVLDVFREPGNFIDRFGRSYSMDPAVVARLGSTFIRAQQATGIAATAKHFPGLGAAARDENTDLAPVTLDLPLRTIRRVDERPYRPAIAAGVDLVMSSWAVYPALDPRRPAGISPRVVRGELRERLGFRGVTITDALEAGALQAFGSAGERGVLAAQAGEDLLLYSARDVAQGTQGLDALVGALRSGRLDQRQARQATRRVLALRRGLR